MSEPLKFIESSQVQKALNDKQFVAPSGGTEEEIIGFIIPDTSKTTGPRSDAARVAL